ncbi:hypothetical protein EPUS_06312 [Endocarpon pusillum Z07020]|uniref:Ubiquitin-like domain-containing protein n=1 Tax=Endocarpon pusillum (strain Z07020 / HMAS-L-300199) TaxID=1263415 RepID=U1I4P6_ENDPU|nr:uncharacterized protein EPUS_06312 [Endocarpon pusillum Z07020]ERF77094.1 hypothetical protein EPUS_06312 [Endocarpon pusillum Z07020]
MAEAFGFSTGDFINSINLVKDIIKALNDSKGSSREYLEVIAELRGLETVLILVKTQYNTTAQISQRTALRQAVEDCHTCIDNFLRSIQKYHGHLTTLGSNNKWKDGLRKIQWHLCKADELSSFRLRIASQVQNIEMLLVTIQASALSLSTQSAQAQERELKCQTGELSSMTFSMLQKIQDSLPLQVMLQKPVMFLDALDRLAPIHLEWINSHEAFFAVLKVRFKHVGLQMIKSGQFALQATKRKRDVDLNRPWDSCLYPGQAYDMTCHYLCFDNPGEEITCKNCQTTFQRVLKCLRTTVATKKKLYLFRDTKTWLIYN